MMRLLQILVGAVAAAVMLLSCSSDGCTNNRNSIPMAGFYDLATGSSVSVTGLKVYGQGAPNDSMLLDPKSGAHQIYLPLRGSKPQTSFVFESGNVADILTLTYDSYPYFDGEDCGAMWRYAITGVDYNRTLIDSVLVTDSLITNIERERLMIFLTLPEPEPEPEPETPEVPETPAE